MAATRKSLQPAEISPGQRRNEVVSILAAGLVRLIGHNGATAGPQAETLSSFTCGALATMSREDLSDFGENGLELSRGTRLSGVAG